MARTKTQKTLLLILSYAAVVVAAAALIVAIATLERPELTPQEPETPTQTQDFSIFPDVPRNTFDKNLFRYRDGYLSYPDAKLGVDVSSHQDDIDWKKVRRAGVEFAIIRAAYRGYTDGGLNMDPMFRENLKGAMEAGLKVGVYVFSQAITVEEARQEAQLVLEALDGSALDLPVFFDWEYVEGKSRTAAMSGPEITEFALAFCSEIEKSGYRSGVYFNVSLGYTALNLSSLKDRAFWLAQYQESPDFIFGFQFLQYTDGGSVPGIDGNVDLNLMLPVNGASQ